MLNKHEAYWKENEWFSNWLLILVNDNEKKQKDIGVFVLSQFYTVKIIKWKRGKRCYCSYWVLWSINILDPRSVQGQYVLPSKQTTGRFWTSMLKAIYEGLWAGRMMGSLPSVPFVSHSGVQAELPLCLHTGGPEPAAETASQQISVCGEGLYVFGLLTAS